MTTRLIGGRGSCWEVLTRAARKSRRAFVATAYVGSSSAELLPLPAGSWLAADASLGAVAGGRTRPAELLKLKQSGVHVYPCEHLHAKVFVFDHVAYVGSTNLSQNSSDTLIEALVEFTDPGAVRAARHFVRSLCVRPLSDIELLMLEKSWRPPRIPKGTKDARQRSKSDVTPKLAIAHVEPDDWTDDDEKHYEKARSVAKRSPLHEARNRLEVYRALGTREYAHGTLILRVTTERDGRKLVSPPSKIVDVRRYPAKRGVVRYVFLDTPAQRRRRLETFTTQLRRGGKELLSREGLVPSDRAREILEHWRP
jgi:hypothetical protein